MINSGLWHKEISAGRGKFLVMLAIMAVLAAGVPLTYDFIVPLVEKARIPEMFKGQAEMLKDYRYFMWSQWFGKNLWQFGSMMALILGATAVSSEVFHKTMQFLLTKPLRRQDVFAAKYLVNLAVLALVVIISTLVLWILAGATGHQLPPATLIQNTIMSLAGLSLIFTLSLYMSTLFDQSMKAFLASGAAALVLGVPGYMPVSFLQEFSVYYQMSGVSIFIGKGFPFGPFLVMAAISVLLYMLGRNRFMKRDF